MYENLPPIDDELASDDDIEILITYAENILDTSPDKTEFFRKYERYTDDEDSGVLLEGRITDEGGMSFAEASITVFDFDDDGDIRHLLSMSFGPDNEPIKMDYLADHLEESSEILQRLLSGSNYIDETDRALVSQLMYIAYAEAEGQDPNIPKRIKLKPNTKSEFIANVIQRQVGRNAELGRTTRYWEFAINEFAALSLSTTEFFLDEPELDYSLVYPRLSVSYDRPDLVNASLRRRLSFEIPHYDVENPVVKSDIYKPSNSSDEKTIPVITNAAVDTWALLMEHGFYKPKATDIEEINISMRAVLLAEIVARNSDPRNFNDLILDGITDADERYHTAEENQQRRQAND